MLPAEEFISFHQLQVTSRLNFLIFLQVLKYPVQILGYDCGGVIKLNVYNLDPLGPLGI